MKSAFNYIWEFVLQLLPVFAAVFFGSPALSSEIESRTAFNVFPLPVSRFVLHLGKFFAALTVELEVLFSCPIKELKLMESETPMELFAENTMAEVEPEEM